MKTQMTLETVRPQATIAMILGTSEPPPPNARRAGEARPPADPYPQGKPDDLAKFQQEIRRRYAAALRQSRDED